MMGNHETPFYNSALFLFLFLFIVGLYVPLAPSRAQNIALTSKEKVLPNSNTNPNHHFHGLLIRIAKILQ